MAKEYPADLSGAEFIGTGNREVTKYDRVTNKKTDIPDGIRLTVVDKNNGYRELSVHLPEQTVLLWPDGVEPNDERVEFEGLVARPYVSNGRIQYSATAKSAKLAGAFKPVVGTPAAKDAKDVK